jgi:hypothetical protein
VDSAGMGIRPSPGTGITACRGAPHAVGHCQARCWGLHREAEDDLAARLTDGTPTTREDLAAQSPVRRR